MKSIKKSSAIPVIEAANDDATSLSPRFRYALNYAQKLGWAVFPCHTIINGACTCGNAECRSQGKHPMTKNGVLDATTNIEQIIDWWTQYPHANIAVATGKVSGIVVIDIDINHTKGKYGDASLEQLEMDNKSKLPNDVYADTGGGGLHYIFEYPQDVEIKNSASRLGVNLDVRSDSGYIIAEPSLHISGNEYAWDSESDPLNGAIIPPMPQWLIDLVKTENRVSVKNNANYNNSGSEWDCLSDNTKKELIEALNHCPNELRDDWVRYGMALHATDSGETGFNLWTDWSKSSSKYDAQDTARVWTSFNNSKDVRLNKETIFYDARTKYNWIPKPPQISIDYPPTPDDPKATAREFLKSIGLNPDEIEFNQAKAFDSKTKKTFDTITLTQDGVTFHHFIDCAGSYRDKTRHSGKYTGKVYSTPSLGGNETIYITECPIDALSLAQAGLQSTAIYNGSNVPVDYYKSNDAQFVVAFNDIKSAYQTIKYFKSLQGEEAGSLPPEVIVALPPDGKTWNDLLQAGELTPETMDVCKWRGRLAMANSAADYFAVYRELKKHRSVKQLAFSFNGWTWMGYLKIEKTKDGEVPVEYAKRITDCTVKILYSIEDDTLAYDSKMSHIIELHSTREKTNRVTFKASELSSPSFFREKLANYRQISDCELKDLSLLVEHLYSSKPPKVRKMQMIGYDRKSSNYVFNKFLYDTEGNRHDINNEGYFSQGLMPYLDKSINCVKSIIEATPDTVKQFLFDLHHVFGDNGLLAFGYYISATYSHTVFDRYNFFPFLSLYGAPHMGKSTLSVILNRAFFIDWEGITMSKGNTKKADLRKIGVKSGLVTPMLECTGVDSTNFSIDMILGAYNRNPIGSRAAFTNDNQTIDIEIHGALSFVQNIEPFTTRPQKERVISLNFPEGSLDTISDPFKRLTMMPSEKLAGIGDYILKNRKNFESSIIEYVDQISADLNAMDVKTDRIAKNHAVALAGIFLLMDKLGVDRCPSLMQYTAGVAIAKCFSAKTELDIAEHFFSMLDTITNEDYGVSRRGDLLNVNMPKVLHHVKERFGENTDKNRLFSELRKHERFVETNKMVKIANSSIRCWVFKVDSHK